MSEEFSAGGVLFKDGEVLLIKNPSDVWTSKFLRGSMVISSLKST